MQTHTLIHSAYKSPLQDNSDFHNDVQFLSSRGYWIYLKSCKALIDIYKEALQKLTSLLSLDTSQQCNAQELQSLLQPPLDILSAAIRQGMLFLMSCTPELPNPFPISSVDHIPCQELSGSSHYRSASGNSVSDEASTSSEYRSADESYHKALIMGLASDVADLHLHDLLIAFCAVASAMEVYNNKQYMRSRDTETRENRPQIAPSVAPSPDLFWKEQNKPHVLLVSGTLLDNVKKDDELSLTNPWPLLHLDAIHNTKSGAKLVAVMEEVVKCSKQAFEESISPSVFLNINDLDFKPRDIIYSHGDPNGATATVHKVSWLGKEFALKTYKKQSEAMFLQEASVHIRLHHPNVIHAIGLFHGEKKCGILMELMDGNLKDFWQKHPNIKLQDKVKIMLQIANGMEYVHRRGLIHRDLKTLNVLVSSSGMDIPASTCQQINVKIADFGTAKPRPINSSSFATKKVGTHVFRAPEVLNDDVGSPSYKSSADVYSFAMTCFELLAEKEPFHSSPTSGGLLFQKIREGERPDLASIRPLYLQHCLSNWWDGIPDNRHSFAHICIILRHLYACLASCQSGEAESQQFPFLEWDLSKWKLVQGIVQENMQKFNDRRGNSDWQSAGYVSKCTRVNEIPYEMHLMNWAIKEVARPSVPSKSFYEKLKEFCCFSADIKPSNHEAFHDHVRRRN